RRLRREGCGSRRTLSIRHVPDSERDCACPTDGECADKLGLAVIHLREEPDALTSARPDPSGGYHASDIPTGISKSPPTDPGIARDPPHSVEDNSHTFRKFDIDDARSLYMPSRGFGSGQDVPFAPPRSRSHRTDPSRTGSLPIPAAIP